MSGAIPPLPQYAFIVLCSVKKSTGTTLPFTFFKGGIHVPHSGRTVGIWQRSDENI